MAKTFEAMQRHISVDHNGESRVSAHAFFPEFTSRKQLGDLAKKMDFFAKKSGAKIFCMTGCRGGEGVSTIIVNFCKYITEKKEGLATLLLDGNFREPVLHNFWQCPVSPGLADALLQGSDLDNCQLHSKNTLTLLPGGVHKDLSLGGHIYDNLLALLAEAKTRYDRIIIDAPAVLNSSDAIYLSMAADVSFLVIEAGTTTKEVAERAKIVLEENECLVGGVLLNKTQQVIPGALYKLF